MSVEGKKSRSEALSDEIVRYILTHDLKVGERLPNEYELSQLLGAGRSSVREAVKQLVSRNVVEIRHGAGTFVSAKQGVAEDPLGFSLIRDRTVLARDLMEIRLLLEPSIAAMAARNASAEEKREILALCRETEELIERGVNHLEKDVALHTRIAECSGNLIVPRLIPIITGSIGVFIDLTRRDLLAETVQTHRELAEAIARGDAEAAHDAMYLHLIYNRRRLRQP